MLISDHDKFDNSHRIELILMQIHRYTSLTGFSDHSIPNVGLLQLYLLGKWLEQAGYSFWNLGHPPKRTSMKYKNEIGGRVLRRADFLTRWRKARDLPLCNLGEELDIEGVFAKNA